MQLFVIYFTAETKPLRSPVYRSRISSKDSRVSARRWPIMINPPRQGREIPPPPLLFSKKGNVSLLSVTFTWLTDPIRDRRCAATSRIPLAASLESAGDAASFKEGRLWAWDVERADTPLNGAKQYFGFVCLGRGNRQDVWRLKNKNKKKI